MNKDEMVEEMAKITNFTAFDYRQGTIQSKTIYTAMAEALINEGYRKVADDEIVESMKTYERARQETAREILTDLLGFCGSKQKFCIVDYEHKTLIDLDELWTKLNNLQEKYNIELEE